MIIDVQKKAIETFIYILSDHQVSPDNITPVINGIVKNPLTNDQKCAIEVLCKINNILADRGDFLRILYGILDYPRTNDSLSTTIVNGNLIPVNDKNKMPLPNGITVY